MSPQPILIAGTGGSGREVFALLQDIEAANRGTWDFRGFVGIEPPNEVLLERLGAPFLGSHQEMLQRMPEARSWHFAIGIGEARRRSLVWSELSSIGMSPATLIHPSVLIGPDVEIEPGAVICARTVITTNVRIGRGVQINIGCTVGHDSRWREFVTLGQGVNVAGNVRIGEYATVYTQAVLLPGVTVGLGAVVGAGAVVTKDVAANQTVAGVPARLIESS